MTDDTPRAPDNRHGRSGEQLVVGDQLITRLRIALVSVAVALILANVTSYTIGRNATDAAARRTDTRVSALEAQLRQEMNARRDARDAEQAARDAATAVFRRDACILADRIHPRDAAVQEFRKRHGCADGPLAR